MLVKDTEEANVRTYSGKKPCWWKREWVELGISHKEASQLDSGIDHWAGRETGDQIAVS